MRQFFSYVLFLFVLTGFIWFMYAEYRDEFFSWFAGDGEQVRIFIADRPISVSIANTEAERQQGLSGTDELERYEGKLFIFDEARPHGIWMKDMNYAIDILWFNEATELVYIKESVTPDTYPDVFRPTEPARYVVELRAGTVEDLQFVLGDRLSIPPVYVSTE